MYFSTNLRLKMRHKQSTRLAIILSFTCVAVSTYIWILRPPNRASQTESPMAPVSPLLQKPRIAVKPLNERPVKRTKSDEWAFDHFWDIDNRHQEDVIVPSELLTVLRTLCQQYDMPVRGNGPRNVMWITSEAPINCTTTKVSVLANELSWKVTQEGFWHRKRGNAAQEEDSSGTVTLYGNRELMPSQVDYLDTVSKDHQIYTLLLAYTAEMQLQYVYPQVKELGSGDGREVDLGIYPGLALQADSSSCPCLRDSPISCSPKFGLPSDSIDNFATYVHMIGEGIIDAQGRVYARSIQIEANQCRSKLPMREPIEYIEEKEIFSIASSSHNAPGSISRLLPFVRHLQSHPDILIHVSENTPDIQHYLRMLHLDPGRTRSGAIKAELIYLPQGQGCDHSNSFTLPLLSNLHSEFVQQAKLPVDIDSDLLVLLAEPDDPLYELLADELFTSSIEDRLNFKHFRPESTRSFAASLVTFQRAKMVVAIGNAQLGDVVRYCPPGVTVLHVTAGPSLDPKNIELSWKLGLAYKGLVVGDTSREGLLDHRDQIVQFIQHAIDEEAYS